YHQGSSTSGSLEAELEQLSDGWHTIILRCYDGVGNMSMDTLRLESLQGEDLAIQQELVYPNPGSGRRCFSFRVTADAFVRISIYTVAGRRIRTLSSDCSQGYNQIVWDGLDAEGDRPATGSYVYRIEAVASGSSVFDTEAEEMGVLAVVEGG
ncbi:MAG: FlgD immunoglobulin-like domain containing protein, partial [Candidatus Fermentibacterota bacterium]